MKSFETLWAELSEKALTRPEGSGTVAALDAGIHDIGKKILEEAGEVWLAAEHESNILNGLIHRVFWPWINSKSVRQVNFKL